MRADDDVDMAVLQPFHGPRLRLVVDESREHLDHDREILQPLPEHVEVLLRKHSGRGQQRDLLPAHRRLERGAQGELGLAEPTSPPRYFCTRSRFSTGTNSRSPSAYSSSRYSRWAPSDSIRRIPLNRAIPWSTWTTSSSGAKSSVNSRVMSSARVRAALRPREGRRTRPKSSASVARCKPIAG